MTSRRKFLPTSMSNLLICCFFILIEIPSVFSISCYKCSSINGSNPLCEDFFQGDRQTDQSSSLLQSPCLTQLRGRQGLFPATHCIKLLAYPTGSRSGQYIYRTCAREDDDDNNGITRTSHCGFVKLDWIDRNRRFRGCLHVCDKDGCNSTSSIFNDQRTFCIFIIFFSLIYLCQRNSH